MNLESIRGDKAGTILRFSIPSIIAMILTSLITVADGFFIGNFVGGSGIAAVNLGLPIIYLYLAVGLMVSVGGIAIAGMALGGGDIQKCNNVFNQTMSTVVAASVSVASCGSALTPCSPSFEPTLSCRATSRTTTLLCFWNCRSW